MAFMVLAVVLFSPFFIAAHADHDCTGEDCPICEFMHQCENTVRGIGSGITAEANAIMPVITAIMLMSLCVSSFQHDTPVSRKVRLND